MSGPHCSERPAAEKLEEAGAFAALPARLRYGAVEFRLLAACGLLVAADLLGAGGVAGAAIDRGKLRFEPAAGLLARAQGHAGGR